MFLVFLYLHLFSVLLCCKKCGEKWISALSQENVDSHLVI